MFSKPNLALLSDRRSTKFVMEFPPLMAARALLEKSMGTMPVQILTANTVTARMTISSARYSLVHSTSSFDFQHIALRSACFRPLFSAKIWFESFGATFWGRLRFGRGIPLFGQHGFGGVSPSH